MASIAEITQVPISCQSEPQNSIIASYGKTQVYSLKLPAMFWH
jgi:hypothetical protein